MIANSMKTLTEFNGFAIKNALNAKKELVAAGKTPEELPQALGEQLKLEGDKLTLFLQALDVAESKSENLKRIVVFSLNEGESAPKGSVQKEDKYLLAEFFYVPQPKKERPAGGPHQGKRDGKRRGGKGGKRFNKGRPGQGGAEAKGDGQGGGAPSEGGKEGGRGRRGPRRDRKPREAGAAPAASGGGLPKPNVKPNVKPVNAGQTTAPAAAPESAAPKTES